jgi:hypothetical protein
MHNRRELSELPIANTVVLGLCGLVSLAAGAGYIGRRSDIEVERAQLAARQIVRIARQLERYRVRQGRYPAELSLIVNKNLDPWGQPFRYLEWQSRPARPGGESPNAIAYNPKTYDLWSSGPDGVDQRGRRGSDDLCNWEVK